MTKASQSFAPALVDTAPEIPAIELPLLREIEERAGERRHVWLEEMVVQNDERILRKAGAARKSAI